VEALQLKFTWELEAAVALSALGAVGGVVSGLVVVAVAVLE
jgi:hypothetical protein